MSAELASEPNWNLLKEYCEARAFNFRDRAAVIAEQLIDVARPWSFEERKRFALWLMNRTGSQMERAGALRYSSRFIVGGDGLVAPRRVVEAVVLPTLVEWRERAPANPEPHFWLGLFGDGAEDCLREALRLNPTFGPAAAALATLIVRAIEYNQHELPSGYLGDPFDDLGSLNEAKVLLTEVVDPSVLGPLEEKVSILEATARDWVTLRDQFKEELSWAERLSIWRTRAQKPIATNL
jgi:hypothetical protein